MGRVYKNHMRRILGALLLAILLAGCAAEELPAGDNKIPITLVINYGTFNHTYDLMVNQSSVLFDVLAENVNMSYTEDPTYGAFITAINGVESAGGKYWMYYVNGELAQVGVSSYIVQSNDVIEFRYEVPSF